jgi:hypothetical protein
VTFIFLVQVIVICVSERKKEVVEMRRASNGAVSFYILQNRISKVIFHFINARRNVTRYLDIDF